MSYDDTYVSPMSYMLWPLVGVALLVGVQCVVARVAASKAQEVLSKMRVVCDEASAQHPTLSFHCKDEIHAYGRRNGRVIRTNYVEVSVGGGAVVAPAVVASAVAVAADVIVPMQPVQVAAAVTAQPLSAAERLKNLDDIRSMLSREEYEAKRKEIIGSM